MQQPPGGPYTPLGPPPAPPPPPGYPQPYGQPQPYGYMQPYAYAIPPRSNRRRWWIWGCGGCGTLALLAVAAIVFIALRTFSNSPLRQFPTEAGASTTRDSFQSSNGQSSETLVISDPRALADVEAFYEVNLSRNGWTVQGADPGQAHSGDTWPIGRSATASQTGSISFVTVGATTVITVDFQY